MSADAAAVIDLAFDLEGRVLPDGYAFPLWAALTARVPALASLNEVAVLPLRTSPQGQDHLLSRRSKLVIRLPARAAKSAAALSASTLEISGHTLILGQAHARALQPYPTLHAQQVVGAQDEAAFLNETEATLAARGISANLICGQRRHLSDGNTEWHGYSLVVHDLSPDDSIRLQAEGLGPGRCHGCGVFTPYKAITGLG